MITQPSALRKQCAVLAMAAVLCTAATAQAQTDSASNRSRCGDAPSVGGIFKETAQDFGRLAAPATVGLLAMGSIAAASANTVDGAVSRNFSELNVNNAFGSGAIIGSTGFQLGASIGAYAFGRASGHPCVARVAADLIQAQLMGETLTALVKQATRRSRPEGSGYSFPSGHTTVTFASATVLQRHFGWKVGLPAYGVATYVAASRVQMRRHYLSDVAFGAALGIAAGRTVPIGGGRRLAIAPMAAPSGDGAGVGFTLVK